MSTAWVSGRAWRSRRRRSPIGAQLEIRMAQDILVTGIGVTASIGQGKAAFQSALLDARARFQVMQRPGRQKDSAFIGAEIDALVQPEAIAPRLLRNATWSGQVALATLHEAWEEAGLDAVDPRRIGLIVGGSNFQQREIALLQEQYAGRESFLRPTYGLNFMDTDVCGLCTTQFPIRGFAYGLAGASASGQLATIQAAETIRSGQVDVCIVLAPLMDLSHWECRGFRSLGAMGSDRFAEAPDSACRPFDRDRDGFIFGECCAALVIEREDTERRGRVQPYARIAGAGIVMDGNRNPDPSFEGEVGAIGAALASAGLQPSEIDYVNPHGTGSPLGDETELRALRECGLASARINSTKSIIGHGLCAAGAIEIAATLLQMRVGELHPCRNLDIPIDPEFDWVRHGRARHSIRHALTLSMGFGGINTALCLSRCD